MASPSSVNQSNNGISWTGLLTAFSFMGSVVYGAWALEQSQMAGISKEIAQLREDVSAKDIRLAAELAKREQEIKVNIVTADSEIKKTVNDIQNELDRRRDQFANIKEFDELKARLLDNVDILRKQLTVLEQTRPTTGELQAVQTYVNSQNTRFEDRLRAVETGQVNRTDLNKSLDVVGNRIDRLYELYQELNKVINNRGISLPRV